MEDRRILGESTAAEEGFQAFHFLLQLLLLCVSLTDLL